MDDIIIGIDLGTTNSEVAIERNGKVIVFEEDGDPMVPSFVGLSEDGRLLVGRAARNQWAVAPERTIKSIKRKMGQDVEVKLGDRKYRPQEISAMVLRTLKDRASKQLGFEVKKAVITVPAYFNDTQRQATREAGELAGLEVVRILNEPTAASLTYESSHEQMKRLAVYDLGGGTFDVSIVQSQQGVVEVLASHGDTQLGGDDFDELLLKHICDRFQAEHEIDLRTNLVSRSRVLNAAEAAKRQLSSQPFARVDEEFIAEKEGRALHLSMELERHEYERLIRPLVDRTMDSVQQALTDAKLNASQIDKVILVGGSTRTPMIQEMLRDRFGQAPHQEVNPDLCVAMGAGLQGAIIAGKQVNAVLIDITPHSLGIRCVSSSGFFGQPEFMYSIIIPRNTSLPATASEVYYTMADNQEKVEIRVYQGENKHVEANHLVNGFFIEGLSKVPAGNAIIVQFRLSLDGTLVVTAKERLTGLQKQVTLQNALARLQGQNLVEARERLEELWRDEETAEPTKPSSGAEIPQIVPVVTESTLASHRESFQARAILEKAEGLLGKVLREDQAEVIGKMDVLRKALAEGNSKSISMASNHLADLLFYLEDA